MDDNELARYIRNSTFRLQQDSFTLQLLAQERYADPRRLARYEHKVFARGGDDGIIQEIFRRIGTESRTFVELGVENGAQCDTIFLLSLGWKGIWVEGYPQHIATINSWFANSLARGDLTLVKLFITAENIGDALRNAGVPEPLDLLSIDIDYNTYYAWKALSFLKPRAVVVEYNATYPAHVDWKVAYDPQRIWDGTFHFGASLKAFELLGKELGYCLVGCDLTGANAFFVRRDLCGDHFVSPFDAETHYEPPRYYLVRRDFGHPIGDRSFSF
jgi:hypothetical protein